MIDANKVRERLAGKPLGRIIATARDTVTQSYAPFRELRTGTERRAFAFAGTDGAIVGQLEMKPRLTGTALSVELEFHFALHYAKVVSIVFAHEYQFLLPTLDDGSGLLAGVYVQKEGRRVPLTLVRRENGQFVYSADLGEERLDGWNLYVEGRYFDKKALFAFDLAASDLAWTQRRLRAREDVVRARVTAQPKDAAALLAQARLLEAQGRLDSAWALYEQVWKSQPTRRELLFSMAAGFLKNDQPKRCVEILSGQLKEAAADAEGWSQLAQAHYELGEFALSAQHAATAQKLDGTRPEFTALRAIALFLSGDAKGAAEQAGSPQAAQTPALAALRYIAIRSAQGGTENADARAALEARWNALDEGTNKDLLGLLLDKPDPNSVMKRLLRNSDRCIAHCYQGYVAQFRKDAGASKHFQNALATRETRLMAWRLAEAAGKGAVRGRP